MFGFFLRGFFCSDHCEELNVAVPKMTTRGILITLCLSLGELKVVLLCFSSNVSHNFDMSEVDLCKVLQWTIPRWQRPGVVHYGSRGFFDFQLVIFPTKFLCQTFCAFAFDVLLWTAAWRTNVSLGRVALSEETLTTADLRMASVVPHLRRGWILAGELSPLEQLAVLVWGWWAVWTD